MKTVLKILAGIVVLLIIAVSIFIATFDINQYKGQMIELVQEKTGRKFEVGGDLELGISLIPTVKVAEVKLGNADWGSAPDMLAVKNFEIELGLIPLLSGNVKINQLVLDTAEILLETDKQGKGNWEFSTAATAKDEQAKEDTGAAPAVNINEIHIKNSTLTYKDGVKGKITNVVINQFNLEGGTFSSSLDVVLDAVYNEIPINMKGSLGSLANLTDNDTFPVDINATVSDAELVLKGKIDKPKDMKGFDLELDFKTESFTAFEKLAAKKLPALGPVHISGHIAEAEGFYTLQALNADLLNTQVLLDGKLSSTDPTKGLDLEFKLDTSLLSNLNPLEEYTGRKFPEVGPLNAKGKITEKDGFYLLEAVNANLGKDLIAINGKLSTETPAQGFELDLKFNTDSLSKYSAIAGQDLPDTGPLQVAGQVSEKDGVYLFKSVNAAMGKTSLTVDGKITDVKKAKGSNLNINLQAPTLADLNKIAKSELPGIGPLSLIANVTDKEGGYQLKDMKFKLDKTDLTGDFYINMKGERPAVIATLTSSLIDLVPFTGDKKKEQKVKKDKVFSADPLPFASLKTVDADLNINAKQVKTADLNLDNVKMVMKLNNGKLSLNPLNTNVGGGSMSMRMNLDASSGKTGILDTNIAVKNFQPNSLPQYKDKFTGASTDIDIDLKGTGKSVAAIMAGSNGKLLAKMGKGTFKSESTDAAATDMFSSIKNTVYTDKNASSGTTQINCGVMNLNIKDGIATSDKGIAISTTKMNIIGSGIIDLKTEKLDINIDPQAREGVGISAGQLAELVSIGGTLANPKTVPNTKAALKTAVSAGAAVVTGGLSILAQGLFDRGTADDNPCDTALGIKPAKKAGTTTTTSTTTTSTKETTAEEDKPVTTKAADTVKDAGSAIKDTFKGLFD